MQITPEQLIILTQFNNIYCKLYIFKSMVFYIYKFQCVITPSTIYNLEKKITFVIIDDKFKSTKGIINEYSLK